MEFIKINSGTDILVGAHHKNESSNVVAIILHGFMSANRIGPYRLYFQIADALERNGINVFRMDCAGCGESAHDGVITQELFLKNVEDILKYVKGRGYDEIHIIGHCFGANVALYLNSKVDWIASVSAISPTPLDDANKNKIFSKEILESWVGETIERRSMVVHKSFLGGIFDYAMFSKHLEVNRDKIYAHIPINDKYVFVDTLTNTLSEKGVRFTVYEECDHHFLNGPPRLKLINSIVERILGRNHLDKNMP